MRDAIVVGMGGFFGSVCRYMHSLLPFSHHRGFPVSTMLVNVLGALLIGFLVGLADRYTHIHGDWFTFFAGRFLRRIYDLLHLCFGDHVAFRLRQGMDGRRIRRAQRSSGPCRRVRGQGARILNRSTDRTPI
jgi:hypothetical protein